MVFCLRVDLESQKGISKGLPKLLDVLAKHNIKASFYLVMGGESNIFEILMNRGNVPGASERRVKVFSFFEKVRMALFPMDFVKHNIKILRRIIDEGHELGVHGWKHRRWTRNLERIDIQKDVSTAVEKYVKLFGTKPKSFCSPAFRTNDSVITVLEKNGFEVISDYFGDLPSKVKGTNLVNVPVTIKGQMNTPIIENLVVRGYSDNEIFDYLKNKIKTKKLSVMYVHGLFECIEKIDLLEKLFIHLNKSKIQNKTLLQAANKI